MQRKDTGEIEMHPCWNDHVANLATTLHLTYSNDLLRPSDNGVCNDDTASRAANSTSYITFASGIASFRLYRQGGREMLRLLSVMKSGN